MTKTRSTKRALILSALSLVLCVSMLVGSTFAWFTDSVTSAKNVIISGNLDVDLVDAAGASLAGEVLEFVDLDDNDLWEPGCTYTLEDVYVVNKGNLALKYEIAINGVDGDAKLLEAIEWTVTVGGAAADFSNLKGSLLAGEKTGTIKITGHMKEEAGNEYQGLTAEGISISVLATQYTYESDSFDNQYDANATFGTYVELNAGDSLLDAMANAEAGMPLTIKLNGNVEWPTEGHHGENDITPASSIVIDGNGYTITATGAGVTPLGDTAAPMTLKNVKIVDNSVSYDEGAWELSYLEMGGDVLNCENVDFADPIIVGSNTANFTGCTFVGHYDKNVTTATQYAVWVENGDAYFTDCTFTGTRGLKICDLYAAEVGTVIVDGCTFDGISEKPGIAIDDADTQDMNITIKNSCFLNCKAGDQGLYIYETDNTVPVIENNIVESYSALVEIGTKEELVAFANRVNGGDGMSKVMVKLTADIDLAGMEWIPVGQTGTSYGATSYFMGIFDGQGHTISNMTISNTNAGEHYAAGFFGFIDAAEVTIRNVNFDNANVKGHHWTGVVAGYLTGNIENCNVTNSTVVCTHANSDACGDKAGAIVGYVNSGLVNNCKASDTTVTAGRDAGQIAGASKAAYVANCTASNVTVSAAGDCTGANIRNEVIGRVL